ncbi:hypothetical protein Cni_G15288 [Canna indica]|uniref:DNA topoisomerase n=1 Tax=Canna indica TaxID=4628 RepID=A0AAQ3QD51_9LILI|nr:hypothetical protein Cni_G15288 [Canna indica]
MAPRKIRSPASSMLLHLLLVAALSSCCSNAALLSTKKQKVCDKGWECKASVYCCNETISDFFQVYQFENLFSKRNGPVAHAVGFWDYQAFITASAAYQPLGFGTAGGKQTQMKEVAAFLGHVGSKTSCKISLYIDDRSSRGYGVATGGPLAWGLCYKREMSPSQSYCDDTNYLYPCTPGADYYGRGALPVYWNYNYGAIGDGIKVDLLNHPEYLEQNATLAFQAAIYRWMTPMKKKQPSAHDVFVGKWKPTKNDTLSKRLPGFGSTMNVLYGDLVCGQGSADGMNNMISHYQYYLDLMGVGRQYSGDNLDCAEQEAFNPSSQSASFRRQSVLEGSQMALQLRRLFVTSSCQWKLPNPSRVTSTMLKYDLGQSSPSTCLRNLPFLKSRKYGRHPNLTLKTINNNLSRLENVEYSIRLPQLNLVTSSALGIRCSLSCQAFGASISPRLNYLSGELKSRRLFSSKCRKKLQPGAKSKSQSETQVFENKSEGDQNSAPKVLRGSKKQKATSTCDSVNGEISTVVSKSSKNGAAKSGKMINMLTNTAECEEKSVNDVQKKIKPTKRRSNKKNAEAPEKNNQKESGRKTISAKSTGTTAKSSKKESKGRARNMTGGLHQSHVTYQKHSNGGVEDHKLQFKPLYPPSGKSVVVVESVTKAKVIQNYLGDMYEVLPSYGHLRDLAARSRSVRPDDDFSMVWEVPAAAWTHLKSIKVALNGAENLILASDPDREGEAIAWHIVEMLLQQDALNGIITVARVVFHEITESSIKSALKVPREIDMNLVNAYLARRALDYLIGFSISPLLWRKLPGCQSAGRVQSAALALICDREMEIEQFNEQEYWTVGVEFQDENLDSLNENTSLLSHLTHLNSKKLDKLSIGSSVEAEAVQNQIMSSKFDVKNIKLTKVQKNPPVPYITSSLQQDSVNKLNFTASYTMKLAQKLYEGIKLSNEEATGLITYMRTDGLHISTEAAEDIHSLVKERYGEEYASKSIRKYFRKVKNAQEAHEAIRPTSIRRLPSCLIGILDDDSLKLYTLIWSRTMACQMESASTDMIQVDIGSAQGDMMFRAVGSRVAFLGYQVVYEDKEGQLSKNNEKEDVNESALDALNKLKVNDSLNLVKIHLCQHYTKPPPRYSEGSLVKKLEELGIGRPSTYASIMKVLQDRSYISMRNRVLHPEFRGRMVSTFLSHHFSEVADYSFTADLETELDNVSAGTTEWKGLLKDYWSRFSKYCDLASNCDIRQVKDVEALTLEDAMELLQYPKTLGNHPEDEYPVLLTHSKFGFSIKHRRTNAPVPKNVDPKKITLEAGLKLLLSKNAKQFGRPKGKPKVEEPMWE